MAGLRRKLNGSRWRPWTRRPQSRRAPSAAGNSRTTTRGTGSSSWSWVAKPVERTRPPEAGQLGGSGTSWRTSTRVGLYRRAGWPYWAPARRPGCFGRGVRALAARRYPARLGASGCRLRRVFCCSRSRSRSTSSSSRFTRAYSSCVGRGASCSLRVGRILGLSALVHFCAPGRQSPRRPRARRGRTRQAHGTHSSIPPALRIRADRVRARDPGGSPNHTTSFDEGQRWLVIYARVASGSVGEPPAGRTRDGLRRVRSPERPSWPRRVRGGPRGLAADVDELGDGEGRRRGEVVAGHGRGSWAARTSCSARGAMAAVRRTPRPSRGHHRRARRAADPVGVREGRGHRRGDVRSRTRADRRRRRPSRPTATGSIQAADAGLASIEDPVLR